MLKFLLEGLRRPLTEPRPSDDPELVALASQLDAAARRKLGRSLSIREVDAGSCNGCELEIHALNNAYYDLDRFGVRFVASPRHADVLLVTGPVSNNMREALLRTWAATPGPKWLVAAGDCAAGVACSPTARPALGPYRVCCRWTSPFRAARRRRRSLLRGLLALMTALSLYSPDRPQPEGMHHDRPADERGNPRRRPA